MDHLCYLCLVFVMISRLFIAALWSPAGKGMSSSLLFVRFNCVFVTFLGIILGQVWYLIVWISDLCRLSFFGWIDLQCVIVVFHDHTHLFYLSSYWFTHFTVN